ncbi:MAG: hypothetical protein R2862_07780 [Thermoanaerobaculia bacterium]
MTHSPRRAEADSRSFWTVALVVLLLLLGAALALHRLVSFDLWWQIAAGDWIGQHGIPRLDPFSYASGTREWVEMRWLFCRTVAVLFHQLGLDSLIALQVLLTTITLGLVALSARLPFSGAAAAGLAVAILGAHLRFTLRPELVTFVLLALVLLLLSRFRESGDRRWLVGLPFLQVIWTNSHTLFVLGPVCLVLYAAAEGVAARLPGLRGRFAELPRGRVVPLALAALVVCFACLANPYGLRGALFPLELFREIRGAHSFSQLVSEFRSPFDFVKATPAFWRFPAAITVSALVLIASRRRLQAGPVALWATFLYLAMLADRNVALFGIVAGSVTAIHMANRRDPGARFALLRRWTSPVASCVVALALVALVSGHYWPHLDPARRFGIGIADHRFALRPLTLLARESPSSRLLTNWGDASLALFLFGEKSVFADGRLEVYGAATIERIDAVFRRGEGFEAMQREYGVDAVLVRHGSDGPLFRRLLRNPEWVTIDADATHALFVRPRALPADRLDALRVDWDAPIERKIELPEELRPLAWPRAEEGASDAVEAGGLAELALLVGDLDRARRELEIVVAERPGDVEARWKLGVVERASRPGRSRRPSPGSGRLEDPGRVRGGGSVPQRGQSGGRSRDPVCFRREIRNGAGLREPGDRRDGAGFEPSCPGRGCSRTSARACAAVCGGLERFRVARPGAG